MLVMAGWAGDHLSWWQCRAGSGVSQFNNVHSFLSVTKSWQCLSSGSYSFLLSGSTPYNPRIWIKLILRSELPKPRRMLRSSYLLFRDSNRWNIPASTSSKELPMGVARRKERWRGRGNGGEYEERSPLHLVRKMRILSESMRTILWTWIVQKISCWPSKRREKFLNFCLKSVPQPSPERWQNSATKEEST